MSAIVAALPGQLLVGASVVPFAMAVLIIIVGFVRVVPSGRMAPDQLAASVALALEFFLAAGLLRLATNDLRSLGVVAAIVLLRRVISAGVRFAVRAVGSGSTHHVRA